MVTKQELSDVLTQVNQILSKLDVRIAELENPKLSVVKKPAATKK